MLVCVKIKKNKIKNEDKVAHHASLCYKSYLITFFQNNMPYFKFNFKNQDLRNVRLRNRLAIRISRVWKLPDTVFSKKIWWRSIFHICIPVPWKRPRSKTDHSIRDEDLEFSVHPFFHFFALHFHPQLISTFSESSKLKINSLIRISTLKNPYLHIFVKISS